MQRWQVFSPEGDLEMSVTMNAELDLLDAGGEYVLVLARDELDAQEVRLYQLVPAS